ncbi:AmpG permease [Salmonella enterica subsp. enterica serovar Hvittingfoss str. A4-620]|nr:AmpG permease [Salmonella enterica subsp. enterica serovar Hvittingfoss str. A4-620]
MQRLSLFRALLIFGILQGASNAGYWLLSITDKNMFSMGAAVFFENLCGGMGTAAFVALLMTLCNKSFSATQFALLSALSAVGRVYVGPVAGWFVEAHGWPTFYLFSVVAAVPGLLLLLVCRQTLEYSWQNERFISRTQYRGAYNFALSILLAGVALLAVWVLLLTMNALDYTNFSFLSGLLETAVAVAVCGIVFGGLLDYLALRKTRLL